MDRHNKLYPPLPVQGPKPIGYYITSDGAKLKYRALDLPNGRIIKDGYPINDIQSFFSSKICQSAMLFVFNMFDDQKQKDFCGTLQRQETLISILRGHNAPYCFLSNETIFATMILFNGEIVSQIGDTVLIVCVMFDKVIVLELLQKCGGYIIVERREVNCKKEKDYGKVKKEILGNCDPTRIVVSPVMSPSNQKLINIIKDKVLKSMNIMVLEYNLEKYAAALLTTNIAYMGDKRYNTFHIFPTCHSGYAVSLNPSPKCVEDALIVINENDALPLEKSCMIPGKKFTFYLSYLHDKNKSYKKVKAVESLASTEVDYHKIKITLIIDENNIPFLYQDKVILPEIESLPLKFNEIQNLDAPVIAFFENSAVICVKHENGYKFLESWNGMFGNELFLHFDKYKPSLITELNDTVTHTVFKASDIIKVMTMPPESIIVDPKWNFTIFSNPENPVLLEFHAFDGSKVAANPAILMALIIRKLLKIIEKKIGENPNKLGISILDEYDQNEKKKRVENQIQEACKMLKIDSQIL